MKKQPAYNNGINVLISANHHEIYFTASSVISQGLLTIQKTDETIIIQKVLSNTNYEHLIIPDDIRMVSIKIISNEINYEKTLKL